MKSFAVGAVCAIVGFLSMASAAEAKVIIQGDLQAAATDADTTLSGKADEFAGLVGDEWGVIKQFLVADPERYNGIRTEDNNFIFEMNENILKEYDGNPYFGVNEAFGGAIRIDPKAPYAIKVGNIAIKVKEGDDNLVFDVRLRGYAEQEELHIKKEGGTLILDPESSVPARTTESIVIENGRVHFGGEGFEPINLLPKKTADKILSRFRKAEIADLNLLSDGKTGTYQASVKKEARVLGVIPVSVDVRVTVDADTQAVTNTLAPWWDLFVF